MYGERIFWVEGMSGSKIWGLSGEFSGDLSGVKCPEGTVLVECPGVFWEGFSSGTVQAKMKMSGAWLTHSRELLTGLTISSAS